MLPKHPVEVPYVMTLFLHGSYQEVSMQDGWLRGHVRSYFSNYLPKQRFPIYTPIGSGDYGVPQTLTNTEYLILKFLPISCENWCVIEIFVCTVLISGFVSKPSPGHKHCKSRDSILLVSSLCSPSMCVCVHSVTCSCLTLCDPMHCSPPRSSVHGISQARVLEWVAISFSGGSSQPRD